MLRILVEEDHFLKTIPVVLDPETKDEHVRGVADFFTHDLDFLAWCETMRKEVPALYPAEIVFGADQADFDEKLTRADAAIVESFRVTGAALANAKRLRVVQKFGALLSNIDVAACEARHLPVLTLPRTVNMAVAEHAFALMIALAKRIPELNGVVTANDLAKAGYPVRPYDRRYIGGSNYGRIPDLHTLHGATLGIVGFGEIGQELARRAAAFGMSLNYHQRTRLAPYEEMALGARFMALNELLANSDYIVVQLPLNETTEGLIGREQMQAIKPGAVLVNVARAKLMDRDAVMAALDSGRLGGLGMDVGYAEPWAEDDTLLRYRGRNVVFLPHTAIGHRIKGLDDMRTMFLGMARILAKAKR
jgi:lactate dehydrogenase-like 2-hydroxyacid dehydrogenase